MNRRNMIKNAIGATAATLVPGAVVSGPVSREDVKHDVLTRLAKLKLSDLEEHEISILAISLRDGHWCRDDTLALLNEDLPVSEVYRRITQQVKANWDAIRNS